MTSPPLIFDIVTSTSTSLLGVDYECDEDDYGDEEENNHHAPARSETVTSSRKKNTGGRSKRSGHVEVEVDEFEPIDFKKNRTNDLNVEHSGGLMNISGYWTDGYAVRMPTAVCISVAGVNIHPKDAVGDDRNAYIRALQEKIGDVLLSSIQAEGHIYSTYREAVEFSKRFTSLLLRHVRMSDLEFLQVSRTIRLNPVSPADF